MTDEELRLYNFRLYPDTIREIDVLVKKDRNVTSRAEWVRQKLEYLISHDLVDNLPNDFDTDQLAKEILQHLSGRIQSHEDRMYQRVGKLEQIIGTIIYQLQSLDPKGAEISGYLESISTQLFIERLDDTLQVNIPAKLIRLLRYEWYGDYLADWIDQQSKLLTLQYTGKIIIWNKSRIEEVYYPE